MTTETEKSANFYIKRILKIKELDDRKRAILEEQTKSSQYRGNNLSPQQEFVNCFNRRMILAKHLREKKRKGV